MIRRFLGRALPGRPLALPSRRPRLGRRPDLESLEGRVVMSVTTIHWNAALHPSGGDFDTASNWVEGVVPSASNNAEIELTSPGSVTITNGSSNEIQNLTDNANTTIAISNGGLQIDAASTVPGGLNLSGGAVNAAAPVSFGGTSSWSGGNLYGSVTNAGSMTIDGTANEYLFGTLTNTNSVALVGSGGQVYGFSGGATIDNQAGATFDFQGDGYLNHYYGGTFTNEGTLKKSSGAGTSNVGFTLNDTGTAEVDTGTLYPGGGGTTTGVHFVVAKDAIYDLTGNATNTFSGTQTGSGAGAVLLRSGTLITPANGSTTFNLPSGLFQWSGGNLYGSVTNAGSLTIDGTGNEFLVGTLTNAGTAALVGSGGQLYGYSSTATIDNQAGATFDLQGDGYLRYYYGGTFSNEGTLKKSSGTGTSTISFALDNTATAEVDTGTLDPTGSGTSTNAQFIVAPGAAYDLTGNTTYTYAGTETGSGGGTVILRSGTLTTGDAGATFNLPAGMFQWSGGYLAGSVTNAGSLTIDGTNNDYLQGTLTNAGTIALVGSGGQLYGYSSTATIDNQAGATFDLQGDGYLHSYYGGTFTNEGTLKKSSGTGTSNVGFTFNNTATAEVDTGTLAPTGGGTSTGVKFVVASGAAYDLTGGNTYTYAGTETGSGAGTDYLSSGHLATDAAGATFDLPAGMFRWNGGYLDGSVTVASGSGLTIDGTNNELLTGTLTNAGTVALVGSGGQVYGYSGGATIDNQAGATFDFQGDGYLHSYYGGTFTNEGTLKKSSGAGTSNVGFTFNNTATAEVDTGTLAPTGGGTSTGVKFVVASGAAYDLTGGNTYTYAGTETGSGAGTVYLSSGHLATDAAGATFDLPAGMFRWNGGYLDGSVTVASGSGLTIDGTNNELLTGTLTNAGTVALVGSGGQVYGYSGGAAIDNQAGATFDFQGDGYLRSYYGGTFTNEGTLKKSSGAGTSTINYSLSNTGTIEVDTGTLDLTGPFSNFSGTTLTGGTYLVYGTLQFPGANIQTNAASIFLFGPGSGIVDQNGGNALAGLATNANNAQFFLQNGRNFTTAGAFSNAGGVGLGATDTLTVQGAYTQSGLASGTILGGGTLTASGVALNGGGLYGPGTVHSDVANTAATVAPSSPLANTGILTVNGNYAQGPGGTLFIRLAGTSVGTQYDRLAVMGVATLDGTLRVVTINNDNPGPSDGFRPLTFGSRVGDFATKILPTLSNGETMTSTYEANDLLLGVTQDVTSEVAFTRGGFAYNKKTGHFLQAVTIKNTSGSAIAGPVSLVLDDLTHATLVNASGTTQQVGQAGSPYFNVPLGAGNAPGAGQSVTIYLEFNDPGLVSPITYSARVLAGAGAR